jgi:hypothetical protein
MPGEMGGAKGRSSNGAQARAQTESAEFDRTAGPARQRGGEDVGTAGLVPHAAIAPLAAGSQARSPISVQGTLAIRPAAQNASAPPSQRGNSSLSHSTFAGT